jgi:hypothetical protein
VALWALGVTAVAAGAAILLAGGSHRPPSPGEAGRHLYVDCTQPRAGDGTVAHPWNTLARASRARLGPGSWLLLRRGGICSGFLAPSGSGSAALPIVIGAYGSGPMPRIETAGVAPDALRLSDDSHVIVQDLELTNHGDYTTALRGIYVVAFLFGSVHDVLIRRVHVHDVEGNDTKGQAGTGGIQVDGATANVAIENNLIEDVNRSGIWVAGAGQAPRPPAGAPWPSATTGVVISGNVVRRVGGDGIVPTGTTGALVADNVVCCGNLRGRAGRQYDAGIWTFDANDTVIERNMVIGMVNARADGTGYDIDYNQDGTVLQSNYGFANAGGLMLLCLARDGRRRAEIRFNLSVSEYVYAVTACGTPPGTSGNLDGVRIYDNTFLTPSARIWRDDVRAAAALPRVGRLEFFNNILAASIPQRIPFPCGPGCRRNLFWRLPPSGTDALTGDPRFAGGRVRGTDRQALGAPFRLRAGSPALRAGLPAPPGAGADYFGDPLTVPPTLGFHQPR